MLGFSRPGSLSVSLVLSVISKFTYDKKNDLGLTLLTSFSWQPFAGNQ